MADNERLKSWEALAIGLVAGVIACASPLGAAALLLCAFLAASLWGALRPPRAEDAFGAVAVTVAAALAGGPVWALAGAYIALGAARLEISARALPALRPMDFAHLGAGPFALLLARAEAPAALVLLCACLALAAYLDWGVRRLADWRIGEDVCGRCADFVWGQLGVLAPLVIFPQVLNALAGLGAMLLAHALTWRPASASALLQGAE